jgi:hypothetical protein
MISQFWPTTKSGKRQLLTANFLRMLLIKHKRVFFRASYVKYETCLWGGLRLIPSAPLLQTLGADYEKMIADGMFEGEPSSFDSIIARLKELAERINVT